MLRRRRQKQRFNLKTLLGYGSQPPPAPPKKWLLVMLMVGGIVGAVVALLFAPRSGKETRAQLKNKGAGLLKRTKAKADANLKVISNWGNYPKQPVKFHEFEDIDTLRKLILENKDIIPRGNGRCYGDSALAPQVISSLKYNKFLSFDAQKGLIRCQAGVILSDLMEVVVAQGWMLAVTPGTKLITVGGAIASDVHGKSQHKAGNFSDHIVEIDLMLGDGTLVTCSKKKNAEIFWATCGGMGLTGYILNATVQLIPVETAYFYQENIKAKNLDHLMDLFEESETWPYSMAWIDCLLRGKNMGRGILTRGRHAKLTDLVTDAQKKTPLQPKPKLKLQVPFIFPDFVLNVLSMKIFNMFYYGKQRADVETSVVDYDTFFYPLDSILDWNRIYGKRGFTQYQFILPKQNSREGMREILTKITNSKMLSFLAVLKLYGRQNGYLPFAMDGYSLALDFPIQPGLFEFLDELDQIVLKYGGRLYLTKDVRMKKEMFMQSYPNVEKFLDKVAELNPGSKFRSYQSDRVGITS